jgi:hypothetical protein
MPTYCKIATRDGCEDRRRLIARKTLSQDASGICWFTLPVDQSLSHIIADRCSPVILPTNIAGGAGDGPQKMAPRGTGRGTMLLRPRRQEALNTMSCVREPFYFTSEDLIPALEAMR